MKTACDDCGELFDENELTYCTEMDERLCDDCYRADCESVDADERSGDE